MTAAALGEVVGYRGQTYELVRREPYVRQRDGVAIEMLVWRSRCLDCDGLFETTTRAHAQEFKPGGRRCLEHRSGRRPAWRDRIVETDPAMIAPNLPDGRPVLPIAGYEDLAR